MRIWSLVSPRNHLRSAAGPEQGYPASLDDVTAALEEEQARFAQLQRLMRSKEKHMMEEVKVLQSRLQSSEKLLKAARPGTPDVDGERTISGEVTIRLQEEEGTPRAAGGQLPPTFLPPLNLGLPAGPSDPEQSRAASPAAAAALVSTVSVRSYSSQGFYSPTCSGRVSPNVARALTSGPSRIPAGRANDLLRAALEKVGGKDANGCRCVPFSGARVAVSSTARQHQHTHSMLVCCNAFNQLQKYLHCCVGR